jgi:AcrR family transcriptional regulator
MESMKRKRAYHHGNLRAALIDAGLNLIEKKGIPGLTLRDIGALAGVSRTAAYRHFASKADLLAAISELGFTQFAGALEAAKRGAGPRFAARMDAMGLAYVRFAAEHPAHFQVMFSGPRKLDKEEASEAGARAFGVLEQTIREAQEAGEIRRGDPREQALLAWAQIHGISALGLDELTGGGGSLVRMATRVLAGGLAPASPTPAPRSFPARSTRSLESAGQEN